MKFEKITKVRQGSLKSNKHPTVKGVTIVSGKLMAAMVEISSNPHYDLCRVHHPSYSPCHVEEALEALAEAKKVLNDSK